MGAESLSQVTRHGCGSGDAASTTAISAQGHGLRRKELRLLVWVGHDPEVASSLWDVKVRHMRCNLIKCTLCPAHLAPDGKSVKLSLCSDPSVLSSAQAGMVLCFLSWGHECSSLPCTCDLFYRYICFYCCHMNTVCRRCGSIKPRALITIGLINWDICGSACYRSYAIMHCAISTALPPYISAGKTCWNVPKEKYPLIIRQQILVR